jgi:hypothetical protein
MAMDLQIERVRKEMCVRSEVKREAGRISAHLRDGTGVATSSRTWLHMSSLVDWRHVLDGFLRVDFLFQFLNDSGET